MKTTYRIAILASLFVVSALAAPAALAGDCYTARIAETMLLPDGTTAHGGTVKVCRVRQMTPASTLHSLTIADRELGLFMGARQRVEADDTTMQPTFLFVRTANRALEFRGVAYPVDGRYQAFRADRIGRGHGGRALTREAFELALARDPDSSLVAYAIAD